MAVNFLVLGCLAEPLTGVNPDLQDNRWLLTFPYTNEGFAVSLFGISTNTWVSPADVKVSETKVGTEVLGFAGDWYNRIHVTPITVNVGNLLTEQTRDVTVWNAYFEPKTLIEIYETADSGMTLTRPEPTPTVFSALEALIYQLTVGTSGPPVVEGSYLFDFGFVEITMRAAGQRVVVWPFMPQHGVDESIEWKTDVIRAKSKEQRIALRDAPRQFISYDYHMNDLQTSRARAMAYGWANRQFGVPVWTEVTYLGGLSEGTNILSVDTTTADYRVGDVVIVWESDENYEAIGVESMTSGDITLAAGLEKSYNAAFVCPMRYARSVQGFNIARGANKLIKSSVDFQVLTNADLGASAGLPTHAGLDVLTDTMYDLGGHDERVERQVTVIDNGFGVIYPDSTYTTTDQTFTISFSMRTRAELARVRKWLHQRKGRLKTFWLPSRCNDLNLVLDLDTTAQALDVTSIAYPLYYTTRTIQIVRKNGTRTYHNVLGGTTVGNVDTLSLDATIGITTPVSSVEYISFMYKVRLDADRIEIRHEDNGYVTIKIPAIEVVA